MKRIFDILIIISVLPILIPLIFVLYLIVFVKIGRPVFFTQIRPGLNAAPFLMYKFRTMTDERDLFGNLMPDSVRLTTFGIFLRATSLDELPELWNVLKGDMSLVGPRPLLMEYLPLYSKVQARRHEIRPGVTGWAQINGRNSLSWESKFELDTWYVDNQNFFLDAKILWLTIRKVLLREAISASGEATMSKFTGK